MSTQEITQFDASTDAIQVIDAIAECEQVLGEAVGIRKVLATAWCVDRMKQALSTEGAAKLINSLAGTSLGFRTDKDKREGGTTYDLQTLRGCVTEAVLKGANLWDDEFQVIGGRCYLGQKFYHQRLCAMPGVTNVDCSVGIAERAGEHSKTRSGSGTNYVMLVSGAAWCLFHGRPVEVTAEKHGDVDRRLAIVAFEGEHDTTQGKAKKKLLKRLYELLQSGVAEESGEPPLVEFTEESAEVLTLETAPDSIDWGKELARDIYGGPDGYTIQAGRRIFLASKSEDPMAGIAAELQDASAAVGKEIDQRAYATLERYAASLTV